MRRLAATVIVAGTLVAVWAPPASAAKVGTITPVDECTVQDPTTGIYTAWYGYENTGTVASQIKAGTGQNHVLGTVEQPEPETFEPGVHAHVFSIDTTSGYSGWVLDGDSAYADYSAAGACAQASLPVTDGGLSLLLVGFGVMVPLGAYALSRQRRRTYASLAPAGRGPRTVSVGEG